MAARHSVLACMMTCAIPIRCLSAALGCTHRALRFACVLEFSRLLLSELWQPALQVERIGKGIHMDETQIYTAMWWIAFKH
jgi:hypothetical protein